jgi:hypothetical protein
MAFSGGFLKRWSVHSESGFRISDKEFVVECEHVVCCKVVFSSVSVEFPCSIERLCCWRSHYWLFLVLRCVGVITVNLVLGILVRNLLRSANML